MGMFDRVFVWVQSMPLIEKEQQVFGIYMECQTKDLECSLHDYVITSNKRLMRSYDGKRFHFFAYTGTLNVYEIAPDETWYEFNVDVKDGIVQKITRVAPPIPI